MEPVCNVSDDCGRAFSKKLSLFIEKVMMLVKRIHADFLSLFLLLLLLFLSNSLSVLVPFCSCSSSITDWHSNIQCWLADSTWVDWCPYSNTKMFSDRLETFWEWRLQSGRLSFQTFCEAAKELFQVGSNLIIANLRASATFSPLVLWHWALIGQTVRKRRMGRRRKVGGETKQRVRWRKSSYKPWST